MNKFEELASLDVNDKVEEKNGLKYLSWSWAWDKFKRAFPDATYTIDKFENKPYYYDENAGYMVMTSVTADGQTLPMWLPVMDNNNRAMKNAPYEIQTRSRTITVAQASMFDINKAIMRCLVKNLAMFGLGLYIYSGEDLPTESAEQIEQKKLTLEEMISACETEAALSSIYKEFKKQICADQSLLELVTIKGRKLKKVA